MKYLLILSMLLFAGCEYTTDENTVEQESDELIAVGNGRWMILIQLDGIDYDNVRYYKQQKDYVVGCKFSVGSYQSWVDDAYLFDMTEVGNEVEYKTNENWLDVNTNNNLNIMLDRVETAYRNGCDVIILERVDEYNYDNTFNITERNMADYLNYIIDDAVYYDMLVGAYDSELRYSYAIEDKFDIVIH